LKELLAKIAEIINALGCDDDAEIVKMWNDLEEESKKALQKESNEEVMRKVRSKSPSLPGLFRKDGNFSITRTILVASWVMGMCLYVFGSLFAGAVIPVIQATIPAFDSAAFLAVTGAASSLYFANHNIRIGKKS